jgi:hypothetical protein
MTARRYTVTVTPSVVAYAGSWAGTSYAVEVYAKDRADAIKQARRARNREEGRYAPKATYTAKLSDASV